MAENEKIMGMKEFNRSTVAHSTIKTGGNINSDSLGKHSDSKKKTSQLRQPSTITISNVKTHDKSEVKSHEEKGERAKLLREKQIEERKKKHEERKTVVEERRRQNEKEDSVKSETLRNLLVPKGNPGSRGVASGRKLPNLPADSCYPRRQSIPTGRLSSGSSSGDSPSDTPPGSAKGTKTSRRDLTGPTSASTSCLSNIGNGRPQSRTKTNMSKRTSSSTNNLMDNTLSSKPVGKVREKSVVSKVRTESGLPKAQSMGAIHQVGGSTKRNHTSKPSSGKKTKSKSTPVHHAGRNNPEEAKKALAEHRRKIREEAERQALLDKEKQEKLRIQREEEEKRLAEENAKEMARQQELTLMLKGQEEERAKLLQEQKEKEEAERIGAEIRRKEDLEMLKKQEQERRVKEVEKWEREEEERLKRGEEERQERRKRVEMIMSRTRMTAAATNNNLKMENDLPQEDLATKVSDDFEHQSTTVSEILQKVKEKSRASPSPEQDLEKHKENIEETAEKDSVDWKNENSTAVLQSINDTSKLGSLFSENEDEGIGNDSSNIVSLSLRQYRDGDEVTTRNTEVDGRNTNLIKQITQGNVENEKHYNADPWENVENFMQTTENHARDNLEKNGAIAEDEDDEDGEEGQLWKVVEGKREISDVV